MSSPKINVEEKVFENPLVNVGGLNIAVLGTANKGQINKFTLVNSLNRFQKLFGTQTQRSFSYFAIKKLLEHTGNILFCRVSNGTEQKAKADLMSGKFTLIKNENDDTNGYIILTLSGQKLSLEKNSDFKIKFEKPEGQNNYNITIELVGFPSIKEIFNDVPLSDINNLNSKYVIIKGITTEICEEGESIERIVDKTDKIGEIIAKESGEWYNNLEVKASYIPGTDRLIEISLIKNNQIYENYKLISIDPENQKYFESVINDKSLLISIDIDEENTIHQKEYYYIPSYFSLLLSDGTNGDEFNSTLLNNYVSAILQLKNSELYNIDLIIVPDCSFETEIVAAIEEVVNYRNDCIAIIDPPFAIGEDTEAIQKVIDFTNGNYDLNQGQGGQPKLSYYLNNKNILIYAFWLKDYDPEDKIYKYFPPSIYIANKYCYVAKNYFLWTSIAEYSHRRLPVIDCQYSPNQEERDLMYGEQPNGTIQVVNPIVNFIDEGISIFGQRTTLREKKPTNRVNVVLTLNYFKKRLKQICKRIQFKPNNAKLWAEFISLTDGVLSYILANGGIVSYTIVCDETTNPPELIANNKFGARIRIVPEALAEEITVTIEVTPQGVNITE